MAETIQAAGRPPTMRERGRLGAEKRWGPPRVIRLDDLPPESREFIAELVAVARRHAPVDIAGPEAA